MDCIAFHQESSIIAFTSSDSVFRIFNERVGIFFSLNKEEHETRIYCIIIVARSGTEIASFKKISISDFMLLKMLIFYSKDRLDLTTIIEDVCAYLPQSYCACIPQRIILFLGQL